MSYLAEIPLYVYLFLDFQPLPPTVHCTEMRFASFLSGGFITAIVVYPPERKLAKRTSVHCLAAMSSSKLSDIALCRPRDIARWGVFINANNHPC